MIKEATLVTAACIRSWYASEKMDQTGIGDGIDV